VHPYEVKVDLIENKIREWDGLGMRKEGQLMHQLGGLRKSYNGQPWLEVSLDGDSCKGDYSC